MPFTASHPAAILPFARSAMPLSALVIGSMVPDLPLFVPMPYSPELSHQFLGVITVDVLAGVAVYAVWLAVLRPLVAAYAPQAVSRVDSEAAGRRAAPWSVAATLIALGVVAGAVLGFRYGLGRPELLRSAFFFAAKYGIDVGLIVSLGIGVVHRFTAHTARPRRSRR